MFLTYIFLHQQWKQCLEFTLEKLREICKYLAGACNSNSHARGLHYLTFVCKTRQGNQRNEASRLRKFIKRAQRYQFALNAKKSHCKLNSLHCRQKTTMNMNMPIIYIEESETALLTLFGRVPGFIEGKSR